jgi:diadenylate cyclase
MGAAALDVAILVLLLWQFLRIVRGTRAQQMFLGLLALISLGVFARFLHLPLLSLAISKFTPFAAFAFIVIFQAEIRHLLARIGRAITSGNRQTVEAQSYDDIVLAASYFAQHQIGALIVIQREIGLRTFIESGVPMDARLSYDLLVTIFRPAAPLHDGAVIIQSDRVAAAACFLPLSMNPVLSNQLGTRHRAAIGVTEETDALAIIVSEETGSISVAQGGQIVREMTAEQLRERLSRTLKTYVPPTALPTPLDSGDAESAFDRSERESTR